MKIDYTNAPENYREAKNCGNCFHANTSSVRGSFLFECAFVDSTFFHQSEEEMLTSVCDEWERDE